MTKEKNVTLSKENTIHIRNRKLQKTGSFIAGIYRYVFLISMCYVILYPLMYMLSSSVKNIEAFTDPSIIWLPRVLHFENYKKAFEAMGLPNTFFNTLIYEMVAAGIEILSCSYIAYGLARFDFKGKKILMACLILIVFIPPQMTIIPTMVNFANLDFLGILSLIGKLIGKDLTPNTLNTVVPFWLPSLLGVGLRAGIILFIYIQFFKGLPKELEEAAWIDGAGPIKTYLKIALPSSGVVILTVSVFSIIWHWNDFYLAVMYASANFPMAVKLNVIREVFGTMKITSTSESAAVCMAACTIFITPMLVMYGILQKKFIKSIDRVGITG